MRCKGVTKRGNRCTRKSRVDGLCFVHKRLSKEIPTVNTTKQQTVLDLLSWPVKKLVTEATEYEMKMVIDLHRSLQ